MNKKIIPLSVSALLILAAGALFFASRPLPLSMEQIFPSGALVYTRLSHVSGDTDQLTRSVFWKNISSIDLPKILEHNHTPLKDVKQLRQMQQEMETFLKNPLTKKFLGKEVAVGFYPKIPFDTKEPLNSYSILGATRLGLMFQIGELVISIAHQWSDDFTTTTEDYHGLNIAHVHFKKRQLEVAYTRIHDVLLVSLEPSVLLHQALDAYQKTKPSLALDPNFSKATAYTYPKGHGIFYANVQGFYDLLKSRASLPSTAFGFKSYTISFLPGGISKMKLIMYFDAAQLNPSWRSMISSCTPSVNPSLNFVPHNVVAYQWGECYDFNDLWAQMKEKMRLSPKTNDSVRQWKHRLEKRFKLNFHDDVLPVLGSQVGGYLNDVDIQSPFPYPRGIFFIKINDRRAAERLMQKLTKNPLALIQEEDYQQTLIRYITLPLGANMDLSYAFLGDYLLLASSRQLLKTSIDALNNPNLSLRSDETLKQFHLNASDLSQGMAFIKIDDVAGRLQQLLDWYNKMVSSQIAMALAYQQEAVDRKKQLQESVVSKNEELRLAQNKLKESQPKAAAPDLSDEQKADWQANIDHLSQQVELLQEDVDSYRRQQQQLKQTLINYQNQSQSAKLWLFNSDEVLMPLLKSLGGLHALGMQWRLSGAISETEIFIK